MKELDVKAHNAMEPNIDDNSDASHTTFGDYASVRDHQSTESLGALRRQTLVTLRWGAIFGQTIALIFVSLILKYDYPVLACCLITFASAAVNLAVTYRLPLDRRVSNFEAFLQLGFDLWQLAALLWLTGGVVNPFSILFLAPVVTAATTLSRWVVFSLGGMTFMLSCALVYFHHPLPWSPTGGFELPPILQLGIWLALCVGAIYTSLAAWRSTAESRKMAFALAATEAMLAHEQKLSALGALAAAAAHELGTPLATIQVTAKEMTLEIEPKTPLGEDAALILSQAQRCRGILEQLATRGDTSDLIHDRLSIEALLEEAAEPFINRNKYIYISCEGEGAEPNLQRSPALLYALKNYIDNAVDFAQARVELSAHWDTQNITIIIDDDGAGFAPALKGNLGQPYASTRRRAKTAGGLGLGLFISERLIQRTGGKVTYDASPLGGARITVILPRSRLTAA